LVNHRIKNSFKIFIYTSLVIFFIDQLTKQIANAYLDQPLSLILFNLRIVHNTGAAFGMLQGFSFLLGIINILFVIFLFFITFKFNFPFREYFPLTLITGGALGNGFDRIFLNYVIDFIDFKWWPVFNIADLAIVIGICWLAISILFFNSNKK